MSSSSSSNSSSGSESEEDFGLPVATQPLPTPQLQGLRIRDHILVTLDYLIALVLTKLSGANSDAKKRRLPPGPWTLPIIGSLHHVVSVLPHRTITHLCRDYGPLMFLKLGEVPAVFVSSAEAAALVMKTNDPFFADRPHSRTHDIVGCGGKGIAYAPYGDHWREMRKVCIVELLSPRQVRRMEGIRAEEMGCLVAAITASAGAAVNISRKVVALSNHVATRAVFGGKFRQQGKYLHELHQAFTLLDGFCLVDLFPSSRLARWLSTGERRVKRCYGRIQPMIADVIQERKAARAMGNGACCSEDEDLLDVLLRLQKEDSLPFPLSTEIIGAVLFDIFAGATEATGTVLEWAMSELICHPKAMAKAQLEIRGVLGKGRAIVTNTDLAELHYMRMVIKEVLRLHPPGPLIPRVTREDCKIMGYDMLKGTNVYINIFAVSRDPQYWKTPDDFLPERFETSNINYGGTSFEFTPFGAGRRQCPGIQFSSSVLEIALANILYYFDWMLPEGASMASFDMSEKFGLTVRKKYDLQLRAIPHASSKPMTSK